MNPKRTKRHVEETIGLEAFAGADRLVVTGIGGLYDAAYRGIPRAFRQHRQ